MLKNRIIPCLLVDGRSLVITKKFKDPEYVGDPLNAIRIFNDKEVDEIIILDITRSAQQPDFELIDILASECFIPVCYGGKINNIRHVDKLFEIGVEKIALNSITFTNINLINEVSNKYGSQSIVASIDLKKNIFEKYRAYNANTQKNYDVDWLSHIRELLNCGAGEILVNLVDRDGLMNGIDQQLVQLISQKIDVPLTIMGGIGSLDDIDRAFLSGASGVAAGAFFVYQGIHRSVMISYPDQSEITKLTMKRDGNVK